MLVITAIAAIATGASSAYFTDTETITGNTFTAGTLDVMLGKSAGKPFNVTMAYPGYTTPWEYVDIKNVGNLPFEVELRFSEEPISDPSLYGQVYVDLTDAAEDDTCGTPDDDLVLDSYTLQWWKTHYSRISDNTYKADGTPGDDNITPGNYQRLCQRLRLPESADNTVQGKTVHFTEKIDVKQDNDI